MVRPNLWPRLIVFGVLVIIGLEVLLTGFGMTQSNQGTTVYFLWFPIITIAPSFITSVIGTIVILIGAALLIIAAYLAFKLI